MIVRLEQSVASPALPYRGRYPDRAR